MKGVDLRVMQGRLLPPDGGQYQSFPTENWREELKLAAEAEVDGLEWIVDWQSWHLNPLFSTAGRRELALIRSTEDVKIDSVCADVFMTQLFLSQRGEMNTASLSLLEEILRSAGELGFRYVILPFVDSSRLSSDRHLDPFVQLLASVAALAEEHSMEIHLETDLDPAVIGSLLGRVASPWLKMNYDIGNSASCGYEPQEEFSHYGGAIGSVHVKDRINGGGTVPLGRGDADIPRVLSLLKSCGYGGDFVLQVARNSRVPEVEWVRENSRQVRRLLMAAGFERGSGK